MCLTRKQTLSHAVFSFCSLGVFPCFCIMHPVSCTISILDLSDMMKEQKYRGIASMGTYAEVCLSDCSDANRSSSFQIFFIVLTLHVFYQIILPRTWKKTPLQCCYSQKSLVKGIRGNEQCWLWLECIPHGTIWSLYPQCSSVRW